MASLTPTKNPPTTSTSSSSSLKKRSSLESDYSTSTLTTGPPPAHQATTSTTTTTTTTSPSNLNLHTNLHTKLHLTFNDWLWRHARVYGADKKTQLYTAECRFRKPHLSLYPSHSPQTLSTAGEKGTDTAANTIEASAGASAGAGASASPLTVTFHYRSTGISCALHGSTFKVHSRGVLKDGWSYVSPSTGETLLWKTENSLDCFTLVLVRPLNGKQKGDVLARMSLSKWAVKNAGCLEFLGGEKGEKGEELGEDGMRVDGEEVLLTALAVAEARLAVLASSGIGYYAAAGLASFSGKGKGKGKERMKGE